MKKFDKIAAWTNYFRLNAAELDALLLLPVTQEDKVTLLTIFHRRYWDVQVSREGQEGEIVRFLATARKLGAYQRFLCWCSEKRYKKPSARSFRLLTQTGSKSIDIVADTRHTFRF